VRSSCRRHLDDLRHGPARGLRFDVEAADHAIGFFRDVLCLNGGEHEGVPFRLAPWQTFIVGSLFGWRRADGFRRFRTAYIEIGKGNGKSPLAAGIGLYCLTADDEPRAEIYAAATKKDQAMILFRDAVAMVDQSPELHSRLIKTGGQQCWNLGYPANGSFFRAISSDDGQSGPRPHCSLIDEVHEHPTATVINMLQAGQKGRRQPLTVEITNSGFDRTSICYQHHEYSGRVVQGIEANDEWFAYVCGLDEGEDPLDPKTGEACWIKANPNLGVSIQLDYLRKQVREARGMPAQASVVRRLNFCQWVDAENPWIAGPLWLATEREFDALEVLREADEVVGALDLSGTGDLSALGLVGLVDSLIVGCVEFWTPKDTAEERSKRDKVPYPTWIDQGHLTATPGRSVDYAFVAERLAQLQTMVNLRRVCFDPYRIKYLERELDHAGVEIELIEHPQGYYKAQAKKDAKGNELPALWMPRSIELLEKAIVEGRFQVQKNPVLTWNSASAVLEADPKNNRIFTKRKSRGRIDGIVSLAMSVGLLCEEAPKPRAKVGQLTFV
jgi:phage terminase large subunit-like protein